MGLRDFFQRLLRSTPRAEDDWSDVQAPEAVRVAHSPTPFVAAGAELHSQLTVKVKQVAAAWALFVDAPHGAQPLAGIDPGLRTLLEVMPDEVELPLWCHLPPGQQNNVRNLVAARLGEDDALLSKVVTFLPDGVVKARLELVSARFWARVKARDEGGARADFEDLLARDVAGADGRWAALPAATQAATTPAFQRWLETRVYGPDDVERGFVAPNPEAEDVSMQHPRFLHPNQLYRLPVALWPERALRDALVVARQTGSLSFFPALTAEVLQAERARRIGAKAPLRRLAEYPKPPSAEHFIVTDLALSGDEVIIAGQDITGAETFALERWSWPIGTNPRLPLPDTGVPAGLDSSLFVWLARGALVVCAELHSAYAPWKAALRVYNLDGGVWHAHDLEGPFAISCRGDVLAVSKAGRVELFRVSDASALGFVAVETHRALAVNGAATHVAVAVERDIALLRLDGSKEHEWVAPAEVRRLDFAEDDLAVWAQTRSGLCLCQLGGGVVELAKGRWAVDSKRRSALQVAGAEVAEIDLSTGMVRVLGTLPDPARVSAFDFERRRVVAAFDSGVLAVFALPE